MVKKLEKEAANEKNEKWKQIISRKEKLYRKRNEIRTEFERDYTRIIHSTAYRRLKHKTQVFFSPQNDHVCTRSEHVSYVESISGIIAKYLGLNTELTRAIAVSHDLGHSPFGHKGEVILSEILEKETGEKFFHEKNGLNLVDNIELLEDDNQYKQNLNLTYGVRDGIVSHCGEIDENHLKPRTEAIDLIKYKTPNQYAPYTWEGCVVKISDKISYILRDIEDAQKLKILDTKKIKELAKIVEPYKNKKINNTVIINLLINDLCKNTSIEEGLKFSEKGYKLLNQIKQFNYENIYKHDRLKPSNKYFEIVLNQIYETLKSTYNGENTPEKLKQMCTTYPQIANEFLKWISNYWNITNKKQAKLKNKTIYDINNPKDYKKAIITYISGMTDNYAIKIYNEIISF